MALMQLAIWCQLEIGAIMLPHFTEIQVRLQGQGFCLKQSNSNSDTDAATGRTWMQSESYPYGFTRNTLRASVACKCGGRSLEQFSWRMHVNRLEHAHCRHVPCRPHRATPMWSGSKLKTVLLFFFLLHVPCGINMAFIDFKKELAAARLHKSPLLVWIHRCTCNINAQQMQRTTRTLTAVWTKPDRGHTASSTEAQMKA